MKLSSPTQKHCRCGDTVYYTDLVAHPVWGLLGFQSISPVTTHGKKQHAKQYNLVVPISNENKLK